MATSASAPRRELIALAAVATVTAFLLVVAVVGQTRAVEGAPRVSLLAAKLDQSALPSMQYFYLPAAALPKLPAVAGSSAPVYYLPESQALAAAPNATNSTAFRSCAIASLVAQARALFPQWDTCGYTSSASTMAVGGSAGVVSGPSDDTMCGPDNIWLWPCVDKFKRTFVNDSPSRLAKCYDRIHDLSLTCKYYDVCGGHTHESTGKTSVCTSPEGDYYKEPDVQRMCGICAMYRAEAASHWLRQHPEERDKDDEVDSGGCLASDGYLTVKEESGANVQRKVSDVKAGDLVKGHGGGFHRVYYTLGHEAPKPLVTIRWEGGGSFSLTPTHTVPLYDETCGLYYCDNAPLVGAGAIRIGQRVYVASSDGAYRATTVEAVERSTGPADYVLVEGGFVELSGGAGNVRRGGLVSVYSSSLGPLEVLPFLFLHKLLPGFLQLPAVSRPLQKALESPVLAFFRRFLPPSLPPSSSLSSSSSSVLSPLAPTLLARSSEF